MFSKSPIATAPIILLLFLLGLFLLLRPQIKQRLDARLPRAVRWLGFDAWNLDPESDEVANRYRFIGVVCIAMASLGVYDWFRH